MTYNVHSDPLLKTLNFRNRYPTLSPYKLLNDASSVVYASKFIQTSENINLGKYSGGEFTPYYCSIRLLNSIMSDEITLYIRIYGRDNIECNFGEGTKDFTESQYIRFSIRTVEPTKALLEFLVAVEDRVGVILDIPYEFFSV